MKKTDLFYEKFEQEPLSIFIYLKVVGRNDYIEKEIEENENSVSEDIESEQTENKKAKSPGILAR